MSIKWWQQGYYRCSLWGHQCLCIQCWTSTLNGAAVCSSPSHDLYISVSIRPFFLVRSLVTYDILLHAKRGHIWSAWWAPKHRVATVFFPMKGALVHHPEGAECAALLDSGSLKTSRTLEDSFLAGKSPGSTRWLSGCILYIHLVIFVPTFALGLQYPAKIRRVVHELLLKVKWGPGSQFRSHVLLFFIPKQ